MPRVHDSRARIVLTCMAEIVPNQSLCISSIAPGRAGAAQHRTCESGHPWRSDALMPCTHGCGGAANNPYCISTLPGGQKEDDCRDAGSRATQGAVAEVELRQEQQPRTAHDCMDAGGRTASGDLQGRRKLGQRRSSCRNSGREQCREHDYR